MHPGIRFKHLAPVRFLGVPGCSSNEFFYLCMRYGEFSLFAEGSDQMEQVQASYRINIDLSKLDMVHFGLHNFHLDFFNADNHYKGKF